jgi:hypothetical protein
MSETTSDNDDIACPACGQMHRGLSEYDFGPAELTEIICEAEHCGASIVLRRDVSVTYTARVKEEAISDCSAP